MYRDLCERTQRLIYTYDHKLLGDQVLAKTQDHDSPDIDGGSKSLSRDTVFQTLSNSRRRFAIEFLYRSAPDGGAVSLREISEQLAASENSIEVVEVTYKQRKRVHTSLYQSHLPKLHKDGIVEYDKRAGTVALTERAREFEPYFGSGASTSRGWSGYWLVLGSVSLLTTGLFWARDVALGPLNTATFAVLVSAVVLCSAFVYATTTLRSD